MFHWMATNSAARGLLDKEWGQIWDTSHLLGLVWQQRQAPNSSNLPTSQLSDPRKDQRKFLSAFSERASSASQGHVHAYNLLLV